MTQFGKIKHKKLIELAKWLDSLGGVDNTPWIKWFDETYCKKCTMYKGVPEGCTHEITFAPCECGENPCGYADLKAWELVALWLQSKV